jgi:hypothetical protein
VAKQKKLLKKIRRQNSWLDRLPETWGTCFATPTGAWAVVVEDKAAGATEEPFAGRWMLLHIDSAGRRVSLAPKWPQVAGYLAYNDEQPPACRAAPCNFGFSAGSVDTSLSSPVVFDLDRDGEPEIFLSASIAQHEGGTDTRSWLWTFRNGAIKPYAPAAKLEIAAMADVDKDGTPDALLAPYEGESDNNPAAFSQPISGPRFLAHTLADGTFSTTDAAAEAYAKGQCPSKPEKLIVMSSEDAVSGEAASLTNAVCARVWGASAADVTKAAEAQCRKQRRVPCTDSFRKQLKDWAARKPPLTLVP